MGKKTTYIYKNLMAEMARRELHISDLVSVIGVNRDTVSRRLTGKSALALDEAMAIKTNLFPDMEIEYLFAK